MTIFCFKGLLYGKMFSNAIFPSSAGLCQSVGYWSK